MPDSDGAVAPFRTAYAGTGDGGGRRDDFAEDREGYGDQGVAGGQCRNIERD